MGIIRMPCTPDDIKSLGWGPKSEPLFRLGGNGHGLRDGSFCVQFRLPYKKDAIWAELTKPTAPLGAESVTLSMLKGKELGVGTQRKAEFSAPVAGSATSELVELEPLALLKWKQLEATGTFRLSGNPTALSDGRPAFQLGAATVAAASPEMTIELVEVAGAGTEVQVSYEFSRIELPRSLCCLAPVAPSLLRRMMAHSLPGQWHESMQQRGHATLQAQDVAATRMQAIAKGRSSRKNVLEGQTQAPTSSKKPPMMVSLDKKATRSEEQKKKDQEEEAQMKEAMRQAALKKQAEGK